MRFRKRMFWMPLCRFRFMQNPESNICPGSSLICFAWGIMILFINGLHAKILQLEWDVLNAREKQLFLPYITIPYQR
jgi:hypothetical protein